MGRADNCFGGTPDYYVIAFRCDVVICGGAHAHVNRAELYRTTSHDFTDIPRPANLYDLAAAYGIAVCAAIGLFRASLQPRPPIYCGSIDGAFRQFDVASGRFWCFSFAVMLLCICYEEGCKERHSRHS